MGFFSDLKNKITGGAATVRVAIPSGRRGQAVPVQVQATAKANAKVNAVYLLVRATESAAVKNANNENVTGAHQSYQTRIQIAGAQDLVEGQTYSWDGQVELPASANPTLRGAIINHHWEVQAGLDMTGNDPDSGWQSFEVV